MLIKSENFHFRILSKKTKANELEFPYEKRAFGYINKLLGRNERYKIIVYDYKKLSVLSILSHSINSKNEVYSENIGSKSNISIIHPNQREEFQIALEQANLKDLILMPHQAPNTLAIEYQFLKEKQEERNILLENILLENPWLPDCNINFGKHNSIYIKPDCLNTGFSPRDMLRFFDGQIFQKESEITQQLLLHSNIKLAEIEELCSYLIKDFFTLGQLNHVSYQYKQNVGLVTP